MPRRPRAVLVSGSYPPDAGGPAYFVPALRSHLEGRGWSVKVVAIARDASLSSSNVTVIGRGRSRVSRRAKFAKALSRVVRGADVMFANGLHTEAAVIAASAGVPWVAKVVGEPIWERKRNSGATSDSLLEFHRGALKSSVTLERFAWTHALSRASAIIVPGPELLDLLRSLGLERRLIMIPNGVPVPLPATGAHAASEARASDLVTVTRLVPWKGVSGLIAAAQRTRSSLSIVGDGPQRAALEREAEAAAPFATVKFHGAVSESEVDTYLKAGRIFCLLSTYEGLSFALLRAKAAGLPVVASDIPGNRLVVRNGIDGFLVDPNRTDVLDGALTALLGDPHLANEFGEAGRSDIAERFSLERTLEATEQELISAMGSR